MIDIIEQKVENCNVEVEPDMIFEPDEDFYRSISIEEFQERAREVVETAYKRFINERNLTINH